MFEEMLYSVEERMLMLVEKPSTRVQACQLLAKSKGLRLEVHILQVALSTLSWPIEYYLRILDIEY